jgi:hypothetical protein
MLEVKGLEAKIVTTGQQILKGVNLTIREGEVHAIMGKNGSGKSTLSKVLVGHPDYEVTAGSATFKGQDLFSLEPEERSHKGLFLSFQSPIEIPGVSNVDFLRMAYNARQKSKGKPELEPIEFYAHVIPKVHGGGVGCVRGGGWGWDGVWKGGGKIAWATLHVKPRAGFGFVARAGHTDRCGARVGRGWAATGAAALPTSGAVSGSMRCAMACALPAPSGCHPLIAGAAEDGAHLPQPQRERGLLGRREEAQ